MLDVRGSRYGARERGWRSGESAHIKRNVKVGSAMAEQRGDATGTRRLPRTPSERQVQILQALANGQTGKQIADGMGIARSTVGTQLEHALLRLGAHTRAQAVAIAIRRGLIT